MHRVGGINPIEDAILKINAILPVKGRILDTCMGLGYIAIIASKKAREVITVEKDLNVIEIGRINPWSEELYSRKNIDIIEGDISKEIKKFC